MVATVPPGSPVTRENEDPPETWRTESVETLVSPERTDFQETTESR